MSLKQQILGSIQIAMSLLIGSIYGVLVGGPMLYSLVKSRGQILQVKKRDKKPECLEDPSLGEHKFIYLEDVKIHYVVSGQEGRPLMLFVHGFPEFWYSSRYQIREFSSNYRVVALDQRGYNESDKPRGVMSYTTDKLVKDLKQLIPALGYDKCILIGHDWGGAICWIFAADHPNMVEKLVIMNGPHPTAFGELINSSFKQFKASWYIFLFQMPYLPELVCWTGDYQMLSRCFLGKKVGILSGKFTAEDLEAYKYAFSTKGAFTSPINYYRAAIWNAGNVKPLQKIDRPTLVIWGDADTALDAEIANVPAKYVSNLTVNLVNGASHFVQMDQPEKVNEHIKEFLKGKKLD